MSDLTSSNRVHLSDGDKEAARKLIQEVRKEKILEVYQDESEFKIPFGLISIISILVIVLAIIKLAM